MSNVIEVKIKEYDAMGRIINDKEWADLVMYADCIDINKKGLITGWDRGSRRIYFNTINSSNINLGFFTSTIDIYFLNERLTIEIFNKSNCRYVYDLINGRV
jgi:hypothetical protein